MNVQGTKLETDEDVRRALHRYRPGGAQVELPAEEPEPTDEAPPLFRPTQRPPVPLLTVLDDGADDGETIRLRAEQFRIGRSEGDFLLPHDSQVSSRHAELRRSVIRDKVRWQLVDLQSTNGTYVRIGQAVLQDGQEFIVGRVRLRFEMPSTETAETNAQRVGKDMPQSTRHWQGSPSASLVPSVRVLSAEAMSKISLSKKEIWLGKDRDCCQTVFEDDPYVNARHARIYRDDEGRWILENNKSVNGVWLRIDAIVLKGTCRFLIGEQQFRLTIPS